jgi:RNA polymerase sigma-70 factor (ECF subfamily)
VEGFPPGTGAAAVDTRDEVDRELIAKIKNLDKEAFRELYIHYHGKVGRFLRRLMRDSAEAEEIINDTLWIVWKSAGAFRNASRVSTWILGIAYRRALKSFRRANCRARLMRLEIAEGEAIADDALYATEQRQMLKQALESLSVEQRLVLELAYNLDRSCAEIAEIVGCSVNTVKSRVFQARRKLRMILERDHSAGRTEVIAPYVLA